MRPHSRSHHHPRVQEGAEDVLSTQRRPGLTLRPPTTRGQMLKTLGRVHPAPQRPRRGCGSWTRLARRAKARPRGKEDPWRAIIASASRIPSACVHLSAGPAKPRLGPDARHAMGSATTPQSAPPRGEAKLVPRRHPAKAKAKMEARRGAKVRAKDSLSGAKAHTARAKARYRHSTTAGASSHLKEEGHGTNGAFRPLTPNGQELHPQSRGCRQPHRRLGQEQLLSLLGPERRGPARRQDPSAR